MWPKGVLLYINFLCWGTLYFTFWWCALPFVYIFYFSSLSKPQRHDMNFLSLNYILLLRAWLTLAIFMIACRWSQSCDFCLQFLMPVVFRSSLAKPSYLIVGLPTRWVPTDLCRVKLPARVWFRHSKKVVTMYKSEFWLTDGKICAVTIRTY